MQETQEAHEMWVWSLGQEDPLEEENGNLLSTLVWKIPWTEEPGRLQSKGSQRVGQDETHTLFRFLPSEVAPHFLMTVTCLGRSPGGGKWYSTRIFLPEKSHGQRSLAGYSPKGHKELGRMKLTHSLDFSHLKLLLTFSGPQMSRRRASYQGVSHSASCHDCSLWQPKGVKMEKLILLWSLIPNFYIPSQFFCFVYAADTSGSFPVFLLSFSQCLWSSVGELFC